MSLTINTTSRDPKSLGKHDHLGIQKKHLSSSFLLVVLGAVATPGVPASPVEAGNNLAALGASEMLHVEFLSA